MDAILMLVSELIEKLAEMPQDARIGTVWDGGVRGDPDRIWLAQNGVVCIGHDDDVVYSTEDRPVGAPTAEEHGYWTVGMLK